MATKKELSPDASVESKLQNLYSLQTKLSEIDRIKAVRGALPLEVRDLEDEIEGLTTRLANTEEEIKGHKNEIAQKNKLIVEAQVLLERYQEQSQNVRNNREFDNLQKEIEFQELEIMFQKKKINEIERSITHLTKNLDNSTKRLEERKKDLEQKKKELQDIVAETQVEEEKLLEKAKQLETHIDENLLRSFKRIRSKTRNGLGIVYVQRDACGGCFNKIPPQRQLDIRMRKKIIVCEYCGRIMIDPELAGFKIEAPSEEKPKRRSTRRKKED